MRLLKPKHTMSSVIEGLLAGLDEGTIVLESEESKFVQNLVRELELEIRAAGESSPLEAEILAAFRVQLSERRALFRDLVDDLESLIELTRELRHTPKASLAQAQELGWYARFIARKVEQIPVSMSEAIGLTKMLEIALEEELSIVEELSLQLQISLAEVLRAVLAQVAPSMNKILDNVLGILLPENELGKAVIMERLGPFSVRRQIDRAEALIRALQVALTRVRATIPMQAATAIQGRTTNLR